MMQSYEEVEFSNAVRLSEPQWLVVAIFTLPLLFAPAVWKQFEPFTLEPDQRMPHELSNDYWFFERYVDLAASGYETFLIGDSVIWGEYVTGQGTLSHYLNQRSGQERFGNLGLDGTHPLALEGLIRYYAKGIRGKKVVLHCNPLWLSSPRRDLQDPSATDFNHPRLIPQFFPDIPSYHAEISPRIGVLVERQLALSGWTAHLQQAYYQQTDIPSWTLEHPYEDPLAPLGRGLPAADLSPRHDSRPWFKSGIGKQDYPWIDLQTSLQWQAFQRAVDLLLERDNQVFVLVGPFNEHLLQPESLRKYQEVKGAITAWLQGRRIPHWAPPALVSEQYGDASHPLAGGYEWLAKKLLGQPFFQNAEGK